MAFSLHKTLFRGARELKYYCYCDGQIFRGRTQLVLTYRRHKSTIAHEENKNISKNTSKTPFHIDSIPFHMEINQNSTDSLKLIQQQQQRKQQQQQQIKKFHIQSSSKLQRFKGALIHVIGLVEEITHMDDVRKAQANVMNIKDKLITSGDKKRQILSELNAARDSMQKLHSDMRLANRGSEYHIQLLDQELEYLKKERQKQDEFKIADELERNLFNNLTTAINDSYEKEKIHANSIRTWGYIQTIIASFITFCVSIIGYYYHNTKFGLLVKNFEDNVNNTMKSELGSLRDDIKYQLEEQEERLLRKIREKNGQESWGAYLKRHGNGVYRYFWPKRS